MDMFPYQIAGFADKIVERFSSVVNDKEPVSAALSSSGDDITVRWNYPGHANFFYVQKYRNGSFKGNTKVSAGSRNFTYRGVTPSPSRKLHFVVYADTSSGLKKVGQSEIVDGKQKENSGGGTFSNIQNAIKIAAEKKAKEAAERAAQEAAARRAKEAAEKAAREAAERAAKERAARLAAEKKAKEAAEKAAMEAAARREKEAAAKAAREAAERADQERAARLAAEKKAKEATQRVVTTAVVNPPATIAKQTMATTTAVQPPLMENGEIEPALLSSGEVKTAGASGGNNLLIYGAIAAVGAYLLFGRTKKPTQGLSGTTSKRKANGRKSRTKKK